MTVGCNTLVVVNCVGLDSWVEYQYASRHPESSGGERK